MTQHRRAVRIEHDALDGLRCEQRARPQVGFGGGVGLEMVGARLTDGRVTGIDISAEMARAAAERFRVVRADVAAIPFADGSFDRVYSVNTIFFWPDVRSGLAEILRVLRADGRAVIAAPGWRETGVCIISENVVESCTSAGSNSTARSMRLFSSAKT